MAGGIVENIHEYSDYFISMIEEMESGLDAPFSAAENRIR